MYFCLTFLCYLNKEAKSNSLLFKQFIFKSHVFFLLKTSTHQKISWIKHKNKIYAQMVAVTLYVFYTHSGKCFLKNSYSTSWNVEGQREQTPNKAAPEKIYGSTITSWWKKFSTGGTNVLLNKIISFNWMLSKNATFI